jgi:hypothetical protein
MTENPDQTRRKITRLIENDGMKVGEFCDTIKVSQNAYRRFVQQSGKTKGAQSDVYVAAAIYSRQREVAGLKLPTAASKKAKTTSQASPGASASAVASNGGGGGAPDGPGDFREIELPGEATGSVPATTHARMCDGRSLRTFVSPRTLKHSSVGTSMPSCMDRIKESLCKAHSCSASVEDLVPIRVAIVKCSTLPTFSSRRSALPKISPSRRRGKIWRVSGRVA